MRSRLVFTVPPVFALLALGAACDQPANEPAPPAAETTPDERATPPVPARPPAAALPAGSIADVAERVVDSVVNVSSVKKVATPRGRMGPFQNDPFFRQFFGDRLRRAPPRAPERRQSSLGSGVIVSRDGVVLTNNHVVDGADEVKVSLNGGDELDAEVVGTDPKSDLAVLRLKADGEQLKKLTPLSIGDSDALRLGEVVIAIGNPFGVGQTVTMGIVSATGRADVGIVDYEDFIQTDAAINPGNSGGALVNLKGELVGINTAILSRTGGYQGIGFAIPTNMAEPLMQSILANGHVVRGWLGVSIQDLDEELAQAMKLPSRDGVLVADVQADSPAEDAGLEHGDVILTVDGEPVRSTAELRNRIAGAGAKTAVELRVLREGDEETFEVTLGELPTDGAPRAADDDDEEGADELGLRLAPLDERARSRLGIDPRVRGVVVAIVKRNSPAARAGLRPGDVLVSVARRAVDDVDDAVDALEGAGDRVLLRVVRGSGRLFLVLKKG